MFRLADQLQVIKPVVDCVFVLVVDAHSARQRAVGLFPNVLGKKNPFVRFGNLDERSLHTASLVTGSDPNSPYGESGVRSVAFGGFHA